MKLTEFQELSRIKNEMILKMLLNMLNHILISPMDSVQYSFLYYITLFFKAWKFSIEKSMAK